MQVACLEDVDDSGQPAQAFSMMLKAGQPRPGQERLVAIGSAPFLGDDTAGNTSHHAIAMVPTAGGYAVLTQRPVGAP